MPSDDIQTDGNKLRFEPITIGIGEQRENETVLPVINRFAGEVARFMGDGILAHFGYPQAHEDDPERAVLAGLQILSDVACLGPLDITTPPFTLQVRAGIATGLVVAGDLIGEGPAEEEAIVGETPNLAARLEALVTALPSIEPLADGETAAMGAVLSRIVS